MTPIKGPAGLVQYRRPAISFLATSARPACLRRAAIPRPVTASGPTRPSVHGGMLYARRVSGLVLSDSSPAAPRCFSLISRTGGGTSTAASPPQGSPRKIPAKPQLSCPATAARASLGERVTERTACKNKQRRARCEAWCEERVGTASPEASVRAKGCVFVCPINREKQRGDVRRNGAGADLLVVRPRGFANMTERLHIREAGPGYRASATTCRGSCRLTRISVALASALSNHSNRTYCTG
jgi:hypothetical protein